MKTPLKNSLIFGALFLFVMLVSCKKDDGINVALNSEVNEFIWQGMRTYYYWQSEIADLSDERFVTFDDLHTFLNTFSAPESAFEHFLYDDDRFSWIVDDYEELDNSFQGVSKSFGYEFGLVSFGEAKEDLFGFVKYVLEGSPADLAGIKRGDLFHSINGTSLTRSNFRELMFDVDNYMISFGTFISRDEGIEDNGESTLLTAVQLTENPVFLTKTLEVEGIKVGYLVYNQFINTKHTELNQAFGELKAEGVTEMVLDLRYNPGGSVTTSRALASMLYDDATSSDKFGSIIYNERLAEFNTDLNFLEEVPLFDGDNNQIGEEVMNRLDISRLFILTSGGTASASELIIAGLLPFMDITLIGTTTVGKNVGSITLYDSPNDGYTDKNNLNPTHTYAMQPIISQLANSEGFTDYIDGFDPDVELSELDYLGELTPLGEDTEPLLEQALAIISGVGRLPQQPSLNLESAFDSKERFPHLYQTRLDSKDISLKLE